MPAGHGRAPGARMRSRLNWLILKTLAIDVALPMAGAELWQIARVISSQSPLQMYRRLERPGAVWLYLYRLADEGLVRLDGLRRQRRVTLTPAGRRALGALEEVMAREAGRPLVEGAEEALTAAVARLRAGRRALRFPSPADRKREQRRTRLLRALPGAPKVTAFVSYDLPRVESARRRRTLAVLKAQGYARLHASMYIGPSERLRAVLEAVEPLGVLPRLRWGTLTVFSA